MFFSGGNGVVKVGRLVVLYVHMQLNRIFTSNTTFVFIEYIFTPFRPDLLSSVVH